MTQSSSDLTDAKLLSLVGAGDTAAFRLLMTHYYGPFMAMALANSLSHADSEEAVADAFVKVWHSARQYQDVGIEPKYWLRTLMRHALLDKLRAVKRFAHEQSATQRDEDGEFGADDYGMAEPAAADGMDMPLAALESQQANACFDRCLHALSDAHRDTLQRSLIAGQSEALIAQETAQTLGTVKSRKHYAVKKMQACVQDCLAGTGSAAVTGATASPSQPQGGERQ